MEIITKEINDEHILKLFSEHDDYMITFLGEDKVYYTRYGQHEHLERVWGAYVDGSLIGCVAYREKEAGVGEVKRLFLKKEYRGKGISKALIATVENYARVQGCHTLFLDTRITLEPAVTIYLAAGFEIVFRQGLYIQMEKKL
ncbi:MAG: GNAT family N-acetyltransferase [Lachnospiraceae bacterium]|nr:GNAT family N-acetyltransferase [Lachnospiraceae bacterium]